MLYSLQALRALAAWLVVFHHVMQVFFDFRADSAVGFFLADRGAVGVDIFFVISGFVIYLSTWGKSIRVSDFLCNRLARIAPAYWLYTLITALVIFYFNPMMPVQTFDGGHLLRSLLFLPGENPGGFGQYPTLNVGWTLNYEMFFYLLFALSLLLPAFWRPLALGAALVLVSAGLARQPWFSDFYRNSILYEFLFGVGLGMVYRRGWIPRGLWGPLALLVLAIGLICWQDRSDRLLSWGLPSLLIVLSFLAMEPWLARCRPLKLLGDCSYSVYLLHVLVLSCGWYLARHHGWNETLVILLCVPLILLLGWLSFELFEKRLYRWLRQHLHRGVTAR